MKKQNLRILLSGFCLSSLIALVAFLFLMAEKFGSHLLWESWGHSVPFPNLYKGLLLLVGGFLVFALKRKWGSLPRTSHELMEELKEGQTVNYRHTWRSLVLALLILVMGAGVGPEAPLLGAVIAYSIWQADKLRYLEANREQLKHLPLQDKFVRLFHPSQYLLTYPASQKGTDKKKRLFFIVNGLIIFVLLMRMTEQPSFITKLGDSQWQMAELVLILPLMLYGFLFGKVYYWLMKKIKAVLKAYSLPLFAKVMLGAIAIFGIAVFAPSLLFSGQHAMHSVVEMGLELPVLVLFCLVCPFSNFSFWKSAWKQAGQAEIFFPSPLPASCRALQWPNCCQATTPSLSFWLSAFLWRSPCCRRSGWQVSSSPSFSQSNFGPLPSFSSSCYGGWV